MESQSKQGDTFTLIYSKNTYGALDTRNAVINMRAIIPILMCFYFSSNKFRKT